MLVWFDEREGEEKRIERERERENEEERIHFLKITFDKALLCQTLKALLATTHSHTHTNKKQNQQLLREIVCSNVSDLREKIRLRVITEQ